MPETKRNHPAREDLEILAGTPYRALAKIGSGGMGTILEAEHRALGKRVVVKLLLPKYATDPRLVERLEREARILARIASPHIVTVSDLGQTASGATYVAMERLYGRTLGEELKARGPLPVLEVIHWTREVLAGLAAAHHAGVVHRDIKLDNVFLCDATDHEPRRIKLLDFGIAKVLNHALAGMDLSRHQPTAEGTLLGTLRWAAPEQARGAAVDARADIYAAGLLVYTLIAGRGPFSHLRDPIEAIQASLREPAAPPSQLAPQPIPPALDDAILMAIARAPDERFQSAEAFATALASIARALADSAQPLPPQFAWVRVDAEASTNRACAGAGAQRGSAAPSLPALGSDGTVAASEATLAPTLARPRAPLAVAPIPSVEPRVTRAAAVRRVSLGVFFALTATMTLVFSLLFGVAVRFLGGR